MTNKFNPARLGDWLVGCMMCGNRCWASESKVLSTYTGRGGLRVCPECLDPVDYGLVPYKIRAERSVPFSSDTTNTADPSSITTTYPVGFESSGLDPMSTTPQQWLVYSDAVITPPVFVTWSEMSTTTWGNSSVSNWETWDV